jgi:hypothetical protein
MDRWPVVVMLTVVGGRGVCIVAVALGVVWWCFLLRALLEIGKNVILNPVLPPSCNEERSRRRWLFRSKARQGKVDISNHTRMHAKHTKCTHARK